MIGLAGRLRAARFFIMHAYSGTLRYSPKILGNRVSAKWWLVVDCEPSLGSYYRDLYSLHHYRCKSLSKPAWKDHITVIRNEEPLHRDLWEKYDGENLEFSYLQEPHTNGCYWWLQISCPRLLDIREELGLPRNPSIPFHLSFGHTKS